MSSADADLFAASEGSIPNTWEESRDWILEQFNKHSKLINIRTIGYKIDVDTLTGSLFVPGTANRERNIFRKVINIGGLTTFAAPIAIAHGITTSENTIVTHLYGVATNTGAASLNSSIPIPYIDMSGGGNHISLSMDATNININSNFDYSSYDEAFVVVEYIDEE